MPPKKALGAAASAGAAAVDATAESLYRELSLVAAQDWPLECLPADVPTASKTLELFFSQLFNLTGLSMADWRGMDTFNRVQALMALGLVSERKPSSRTVLSEFVRLGNRLLPKDAEQRQQSGSNAKLSAARGESDDEEVRLALKRIVCSGFDRLLFSVRYGSPVLFLSGGKRLWRSRAPAIRFRRQGIACSASSYVSNRRSHAALR
jgi:hypothetical protein